MHFAALLPLALLPMLVAGCSTPNQVVRLGDGVLRAPNYVDAANYCSAQRTTARMLRKAQAEGGVEFRCE